MTDLHTTARNLANEAREADRRFAALIALISSGGASVRQAVESDPALRTDAIATLLLDYYDDACDKIKQADGSEIVTAAMAACHDSANADLHFRAWKEWANALRSRGQYGGAAAALGRAEQYARRTSSCRLHLGVIEYARAVLAYDRERTEDAKEHLDSAIEILDAEHDTCRGARARQMRAAIAARERRFAECVHDYETFAANALARSDEMDAAVHLANAAHCYAHLGDLDVARSLLGRAVGIYRRHSAIISEAQANRVCAQIAMRQDGLDAGLQMYGAAQQRFVALDMPGEAVRTLVGACETIHELWPNHEALIPLSRTIHAEATHLNLRASAAEATERLRVAAVRHEVTEDLLSEVWIEIDPGATYISSAAN